MVRTQVQLTEEQAQALRDLAAQEKVSVAELVRRAVDHWLERDRAASEEARRKRTLAVVGLFHSGKSDIAEHHDDYLDEAYGQWSSS